MDLVVVRWRCNVRLRSASIRLALGLAFLLAETASHRQCCGCSRTRILTRAWCEAYCAAARPTPSCARKKWAYRTRPIRRCWLGPPESTVAFFEEDELLSAGEKANSTVLPPGDTAILELVTRSSRRQLY